jgi:excinuclease UvrABC nuclease subunit
MKMCLAPCYAGCSKEEYDVEVNRLVGFLETGGGSLRATYEQERERASEELDFERAAAIHKKLEKLDDALRAGPEVARRVQDLDAVILQRMAEEQTIGIFGVRGGRLAAPYALRFGDTSQPRSAEETVRDYLETMMSAPPAAATPRQSATELGEHLRLVARWFYSNPRQGEIFFREKDWPYRRILRACSRLLAPPKEEANELSK